MSKFDRRNFARAGRVIRRMMLVYGKKFKDMWKDVSDKEMQEVWAEAFAGYSDAELQRGLQACLTHQWPPTLPEFLGWCRPQMTAEMAFYHAREQLKVRDVSKRDWLNKAVYHTAVKFGWWELRRSKDWAEARGRWAGFWEELQSNPNLADVPTPKQLEAPEPKRTEEVRQAHKQRLRVLIGKASAKMTEAA